MKLFQIGLIAVSVLLAGCVEREVILPGERTDLRAAVGLEPEGDPQNLSVPISLAAQTNHSDWPNTAGSASHTIRHPALSPTPTRVWAATIGQGNDRKHRISADPVATGGLIFTLDSRATVTATSSSGATVWSRDLTPPADRSDDASGGGLAASGGQVFASTGFGEVVAFDAASGAVQWRQRLEGAAAGAPTVSGGTVYVVSRESRGWALNAADGRVQWTAQGTPSITGVVGGSSPATNGQIVLFPLASAEILAVLPQRGLNVWTGAVGGNRLGRAYGNITDISGDPVIVGDTVYAGTPTGRTAALALDDGLPRWAISEGATGPLLVEGGSVFQVTDKAELLRLDASTGERIWTVDLPYFVPARNARRIRDVFPHYGPVLAGGRLWVASGDGVLRGFDPTNGALVATAQMGAAAASRPIVVNGTMYVVGQNGQLLAFR